MLDLISIIIPVYNTQDYLVDCIESVINQTYENLEIILVDDGSNDNSVKICNSYGEHNRKVKVIHQENKGALAARKNGLKVASGKYVGFVDSDDWIEANMYEILYNKCMEYGAAVVTSPICKEYENKSIIVQDALAPGVYHKKDSNKLLYKSLLHCGTYTEGGIHASLCTKLIEMDILQKFIRNVDNNIVNGDDAAVLYPILAYADTVCITDYALYHYRMRNHSITHSNDERYFERTNYLYLHLKKNFLTHECADLLLPQLDRYFLNQLMTGLQRRYEIKKKLFYRFPYEVIENNARIILYGAGNVGQSYYEQIYDNVYCNLISWVDKDYDKCHDLGVQIKNIDSILESDFDIILIAVKNNLMAKDIINNLMKIGIDPTKIVWKEPKLLLNSLTIE
jgi:glycosyltransferase involved in cell wall biosynthesis